MTQYRDAAHRCQPVQLMRWESEREWREAWRDSLERRMPWQMFFMP